jgi:serine phosphatase RsbU (regulator of sigma subunit)
VVNRARSGQLGPFLGLLAAGCVLVLFVIAALLVRSAIVRNTSYQRELRAAQTDRARLLRLQIDEETGMRGYLATDSPVFLQPYNAGRTEFPLTAGTLEKSLVALGVSNAALRREESINRTWLSRIAQPAIANPAMGSTYEFQLRGKQIVDGFRVEDAQLNASIDAAADVAEEHTAQLVTAILVFSLGAGVLIAIVLSWLAYAQRRLAAELEEQREAYLEEKRVADALQEAFLQKTLPELAKADLHGVYVPAGLEAKVGGDWYDAFELSENRILFSIGDVAGHGIEAAVVMSRVRQAVLSVGVEERDPSKVLERANEILLLQDLTMVTAVCGMIDLARGAITISNAGHPPAVLLRSSGEVELLGAGGPPLGALDRPKYTTQGTIVEPGSMLVLYTDGLIEYGRDWEAGEKRLLDAIRSVDRSGTVDPAASIMKSIFGGEPPVDDVAILTIIFREAESAPQPLAADVATASARPLLDRSAKSLLESVVVAGYASVNVRRLEAALTDQEWVRNRS